MILQITDAVQMFLLEGFLPDAIAQGIAA